MLKVTPAREQDRGLYSCLASNEAGEARRNFSVKVLGRTHSMFLGASGASSSSWDARVGRDGGGWTRFSWLHQNLCSGGGERLRQSNTRCGSVRT